MSFINVLKNLKTGQFIIVSNDELLVTISQDPITPSLYECNIKVLFDGTNSYITRFKPFSEVVRYVTKIMKQPVKIKIE